MNWLFILTKKWLNYIIIIIYVYSWYLLDFVNKLKLHFERSVLFNVNFYNYIQDVSFY